MSYKNKLIDKRKNIKKISTKLPKMIWNDQVIHKIGISNIFAGHLLGFSTYISNTTDKEDGFLCFKDTNFTKSTIPNSIRIPCSIHGRYVIYFNNRTHPPYPTGYDKYAYNELCEMEVYGMYFLFRITVEFNLEQKCQNQYKLMPQSHIHG